MREAVHSGAAVPSLVRRSAKNTLLADTRTGPDRQSSHPVSSQGITLPAGETGLDWLG